MVVGMLRFHVVAVFDKRLQRPSRFLQRGGEGGVGVEFGVQLSTFLAPMAKVSFKAFDYSATAVQGNSATMTFEARVSVRPIPPA